MNYDSEGNIKVVVSALTFATQVGMDIEAGSSSGFLSSLSFSNDNGVSFGLNGSTITASVNTVGGSSATISAGTQSDTLSQLVFADSNGVTFGLDNGTITASVGVGGNINVSAGTTSNNLSAFTFNNGNGISFGLDASTITASHNALTSQSNQAVSAGNGSFAFQTLTLADSNGVSFSTGTQGVFATVKTDYLTTAMASNRGSDFVQATAAFAGTNATGTIASDGISVSVAAQSVQPVAVSASNGSYNFSTLKFIESNGVTWATSTDGVRASVKTDYLTTAMASDAGSNFVQATAVIFGTNISGTVASDKISLSVNAQSSVDQKASLYGLGNTTQNSSTVLSLNALSFNAIGSLTVGYSNGSIQLSAPDALTTARASTDAIGLNTAKTNVTWTVNSSGLSLDAAGYAGTGLTTATTAGTALVGTNNTAGLSLGVPAFLTTAMQSNAATISNIRVSAGTTSNLLSALTLANSNGISFGIDASTITASYTVPTVTNSSFSVQDSATTINPVSRIAFSTGNNITATLSTAANHATVGFSHNLAGTSTGFAGTNISGSMTHNSSGLSIDLSVAAQSNQTLGIYASSNTTMTSSGTIDARSLSFRGIGVASVGYSNNEVLISVPAGGGGITNINLSAGTTSNNASNFTFGDSNGISFGLNASTITASHNGLTSQSNQAFSAAGGSSAFQTLNFADTNGVSFTNTNGSLGVASVNLSMYAVSNTTQSSSGTANHSALSFAGAGIASVGVTNGSVVVSVPSGGGGITNINLSAGTTSNNASNFTFANSNGVSFGLDAGTITATVKTDYLTNIKISAGTTSNNLSGITFSNSNGVSFGLNGSTITADARNILSTYEPYPAMGLSTALVGVPTATSAGVSLYPFVVEEYVSAGIMNMAYSMSFVTVGTSSGRQTMGLAMGIYSRNVSTLSSIVSTSFSIGVTGNNSSYTIHQPTSTAYSGFGVQGTTNSAGSNISSGYTGVKLVGWPINQLLTPGNYWLGIIGTNSTSSVNVGISMSHFGAAMQTMASAMAPIGSFSSAFTSGFDPRGGRWNLMQGSWTSAGSVTMIPASMAHNSITAVGLTYPLIKFWST